MLRFIAALAGIVSLLWASEPVKFTVTPGVQAAINQVSADSLKGNLSFLASDLLEGRDTPSRGLDLAAEFIASQYRRAGLEPGGDDGYFQTAKMFVQGQNTDGFSLTMLNGDKKLELNSEDAVLAVRRSLDLSDVRVFKLELSNADSIAALTQEHVSGQVVFVEFTRGAMRSGREAMGKLRAAKPALILALDRSGSLARGETGSQLFDPEAQTGEASSRITLTGHAAAAFYDGLKAGETKATVSVHANAPRQSPVTLRNVVGILRGSDPLLKDSCLLITAHYDHLGMKPPGEGDRIYNGANDDGSGTVSVIEIASALAKLKPHPKRSIVFVTFFGEEKGLFGSRYYAHHSVFPIAKTIADINLEQVGRTDSSEGPHVGDATLTGFDYSTLTDYLKAAGRLTGIKVYKDASHSDLYFTASDNLSLAEMGVPAETLCVAFQYSGLSCRGRRMAENRLHEHGQGRPDDRAGRSHARRKLRGPAMEPGQSQGGKIPQSTRGAARRTVGQVPDP